MYTRKVDGIGEPSYGDIISIACVNCGVDHVGERSVCHGVESTTMEDVVAMKNSVGNTLDVGNIIGVQLCLAVEDVVLSDCVPIDLNLGSG